MQVIHIQVLKGAKGQFPCFLLMVESHVILVTPRCLQVILMEVLSQASANVKANLQSCIDMQTAKPDLLLFFSAWKYIVRNPLLRIPPHPSPIHIRTIPRSGNTCPTWKLGFRLFGVWGTCVAICVVGFWVGWSGDLNRLLFRARWRFATQHLPKRFRVSWLD